MFTMAHWHAVAVAVLLWLCINTVCSCGHGGWGQCPTMIMTMIMVMMILPAPVMNLVHLEPSLPPGAQFDSVDARMIHQVKLLPQGNLGLLGVARSETETNY